MPQGSQSYRLDVSPSHAREEGRKLARYYFSEASMNAEGVKRHMENWYDGAHPAVAAAWLQGFTAQLAEFDSRAADLREAVLSVPPPGV